MNTSNRPTWAYRRQQFTTKNTKDHKDSDLNFRKISSKIPTFVIFVVLFLFVSLLLWLKL